LLIVREQIRGPSKVASKQVSVHLAKRFQRRFLEIDQPETRTAYDCNIYRVSSIDTLCRLLVHLANQLLGRRLKCEKLTDDK
jgi:hypothetical protein